MVYNMDEHRGNQLRSLVNRWIEGFNAHDAPAIVALYAEDAELFDSGMRHPRRGRKEIERWFMKRFRSMPSIAYQPKTQFVAEEDVAVLWTARGYSPGILGRSWLSRSFQ